MNDVERENELGNIEKMNMPKTVIMTLHRNKKMLQID